MKNNLFEGAKFGDKFLTRDGRIALFCFAPKLGNACLIEGEDRTLTYRYDGLLFDTVESKLDIISRYQEPIDEERLDKLAEEFSKDEPHSGRVYYGYINGYRDAMEE